MRKLSLTPLPWWLVTSDLLFLPQRLRLGRAGASTDCTHRFSIPNSAVSGPHRRFAQGRHRLQSDVNARWNEQWNLHSVWDEGIIDATMNLQKLDEEKYLAQLLKPLRKASAADLAKLQSGDLFTWIADSYAIAVKKAYKLPKFDPNYEYRDKKGNQHKGGYKLAPSYYAANEDVVSDQLLTGGVRLAKFLNDTLAK